VTGRTRAAAKPTRRPRLTPPVPDAAAVQRILVAVRMGMDPARAALAEGISIATHQLWLDTGELEREHRQRTRRPRKTWQPALDYLEEVERAVARSELIALERVANAESGWEASRWILERRFADTWAKTPAGIRVRELEPDAAAAVLDEVPETRLDQLRRERDERNAAGSR